MSPIKNLFLFSEDEKASFFYGLKEKKDIIVRKAESTDGYTFKTSKTNIQFKKSGKKHKMDKGRDFKTVKIGKKYFLTYSQKTRDKEKYYLASSSNLVSWTIRGGLSGIKKAGAIVPDFFYDKDRVMYVGGKSIKVAYSKNLEDWDLEKNILLKPKVGKFDAKELMPAKAFVRQEGIVLIYYAINASKKISIGLALFNKDNPEQLLWRSSRPLWIQKTKSKINPLGVLSLSNRLFFYYENKDGGLVSVSLPIVWHPQAKTSEVEGHSILIKSPKNPIFGPHPNNHWENFAAFNPTAFELDGKIYLLYRALGNDNLSVVGCATTTDGIHIDERYPEPIYVPRGDFEGGNGYVDKSKPKSELVSGGGWGGCEDPKVTRIGNMIYLVYVAFNGWSEPNIAFSSISVKDFKARNWKAWKKPVKITSSDIKTKNQKAIKESLADRPGQTHVGDKNPAVLPGKINGKFVIFHRLWPNIVYDYVDKLDFDGKTFLPGDNIIPIRKEFWDGKKIGIGCAPLKIKEGWLIIYNAVSAGKYKIGAMIVDANDPSKILYRSAGPIIEPTEDYENNGHKYGVVFAGGSVIKERKLFIYYGGSDKCSCVTVADLDRFIEKLKTDSKPQVKKVTISS
ncbi:hypothetical protein GF382_03330 [Candidatus Falkowbacteria bacterium]|nr:hypothetical protein [Candidatus Falkowbacteria bacterium]